MTSFQANHESEPEHESVSQEINYAANTPLRSLCDMLTYKRVSGSKTEAKFINRFIRPLGAKPDSMGNYILRIGDAPIMFSSHTDSVHKTAGRQKLSFKKGIITVKHPRLKPADKPRPVEYTHGGKTYIYTPASPQMQCLGADDAVGCWIMREMAQAGVPGLYIWHRQEESGGIGSSWIADNTPETVAGIKAAIAFDRRGKSDVITHQAGRTLRQRYLCGIACRSIARADSSHVPVEYSRIPPIIRT